MQIRVSINRIEVTVADLNFLDNDVGEEKFVISTVRIRDDFNSETGANNLALLEVIFIWFLKLVMQFSMEILLKIGCSPNKFW